MATLSINEAVGDRSPSRLLRRIARLLDKRLQERFSDANLTFEEWMALKSIFDGLVENAGDLSRHFSVGTGATTRLIDSLEGQGLIERDRTSEDRRVVLLKLTPRGEAYYRGKIPDMIACWNDLLKDFDQDELGRMITLLAKLQDALLRDPD